jgi:F-type H+-transporting ATPase subunit epsilon
MAQPVAGELQCVIVTPERQVADQTADFVVLTAHDGQVGILPEHSPLVVGLSPGVLRIDRGSEKQYFFVAGGFAEILDNRVTVLTPQAVPAGNIDAAESDRQLVEAEKLPMGTELERRKREKELAGARGKRATLLLAGRAERR